MKKSALSLLIIFVFASVSAIAQTSAFTYQGKLTDGGTAANGQFDLSFKLYASTGTQIGSNVTVEDVQVTAGIFTVNLDFGTSPFTSTTGNELEISVRPGTSTGGYQQLLPRQRLTSSPYAVQTLRAASSANADSLGGVAAGQYVQTGDPRLSDARLPLAGSGNYIQSNPASPQSGTSLNIGGTLTASKLDVVSNTASNGENSATFRAPNIGSNNSHVHYGTTGDWYIRSAASAGKVVLQDTGGDVGIGTSAPEQKLHVVGNEILSSGSGAGFKFRDRGSTSSADDWVWYSNSNIARFFRAGVGDLLAVKTDGNVGIGTLAPNATLEVNGYTKLGSDAPSIRVKKLTGTTSSSTAEAQRFSHGLDASKILSVSVMVRHAQNYWMGPNYSDEGGLYFSWQVYPNDILVRYHPTSSWYLLSKPIKIFITYEQ